jgi:hypothetical protein
MTLGPIKKRDFCPSTKVRKVALSVSLLISNPRESFPNDLVGLGFPKNYFYPILCVRASYMLI